MSSRGGKQKITIKPFRHTVQMDPNYATKTWKLLERAIIEIHRQNQSNLSFEELYRNAYNMVLHKYGDQLYQGLQATVERHLTEVAATVAGSSDAEFLSTLNKAWEDHHTSMLMIRDILMYMDRVYVMHHSVPPVYDLGLIIFRDKVVRAPRIRARLLSTLLSCIHRERTGEVVERSLLKSIFKMLLDLGVQQRTVYEEDFEAPFLQRSREFYSIESQEFIRSNSCPDYMRKVEARLNEELDRVKHYLDAGTEPKIREVVERELLQNHLKVLLEMEGSGLVQMLRDDKVDDLRRMFVLLGRVPGGHEQMRALMSAHVKAIGLGMFTDEDRQKDHLRLIADVLELKDKFDRLTREAFSNDKLFVQSLNQAFEEFVNRNPKSPEFISLFIDEKLKKGLRGMTEEDVDVVLDKVMMLFRFVQEKDVFEKYYKQHLAKRLLLGRSVSDDAERNMIAKLKTECLADDMQILTSRGFLFFDEILAAWQRGEFARGELTVAGFDERRQQIVYETPTRLIDNDVARSVQRVYRAGAAVEELGGYEAEEMYDFTPESEQPYWDADGDFGPDGRVHGDASSRGRGMGRHAKSNLLSVRVTGGHVMYVRRARRRSEGIVSLKHCLTTGSPDHRAFLSKQAQHPARQHFDSATGASFVAHDLPRAVASPAHALTDHWAGAGAGASGSGVSPRRTATADSDADVGVGDKRRVVIPYRFKKKTAADVFAAGQPERAQKEAATKRSILAVQFLAAAANGVDNLQHDFKARFPFLLLLQQDGRPATAKRVCLFLELYGFWLGDGSFKHGADGGRRCVTFSQVKAEDNDWLKATLHELGLVGAQGHPGASRCVTTDFTFGEEPGSGAVRIAIYNDAWTAFFSDEYGVKYVDFGVPRTGAKEPARLDTRAAEESPPPPEDVNTSAKRCAYWVWRLNRDEAYAVLHGLHRADGKWAALKDTDGARRRKGGSEIKINKQANTVCTSSMRFRDEVVRLALHAGCTTTFYRTCTKGVKRPHVKGNNMAGSSPVWVVLFHQGAHSTDGQSPSGQDRPGIALGAIKTVGQAHSWCLTMPSTFLVTRRAFTAPVPAGSDDGVVPRGVVQASRPVVVGNCGYQFTSKLEGMFTDMKVSADTMAEFREFCRAIEPSPLGGVELTVSVLTTGYWPTQTTTKCNLPAEIVVCCEIFSKFYLSRHSGRRLTWQTNMGSAEVRANFAHRHELSVSTYQTVLLLFFNGRDSVTFRELRDITQIPVMDLKRNLFTLSCMAKHRILLKSPQSRTISEDDTFSVNAKFRSKLFKVKIMTVVQKESDPERHETREKVDEDRRHQIEAAIVRVMKARKTMDHANLVSEVTRQLSSRFMPNPVLIKKRIESLIEREYLERSKADRKMYNYLA